MDTQDQDSKIRFLTDILVQDCPLLEKVITLYEKVLDEMALDLKMNHDGKKKFSRFKLELRGFITWLEEIEEYGYKKN